MTTLTKVSIEEACNYLYRIPEKEVRNILNSKYQKQAIEFLLKTKTKCEIVLLGKQKPTWSDTLVNAYQVTLKNSKHSYSFTFFDSINNTEKGISSKLDFYSILACFCRYYPESFDEFCETYGYSFKNESDYLKAKIIHLACLEEEKNLKKLFTEDELYLLSEIN